MIEIEYSCSSALSQQAAHFRKTKGGISQVSQAVGHHQAIGSPRWQSRLQGITLLESHRQPWLTPLTRLSHLQWGSSGIDTDHRSTRTHATGKLQG
jgi:hypothetical protein